MAKFFFLVLFALVVVAFASTDEESVRMERSASYEYPGQYVNMPSCYNFPSFDINLGSGLTIPPQYSSFRNPSYPNYYNYPVIQTLYPNNQYYHPLLRFQ